MLRGSEAYEYFNSQPHEEADARIIPSIPLRSYFNSQPHEEADWNQFGGELYHGYFNSQPHEEADMVLASCDTLEILFQLTASRRG